MFSKYISAWLMALALSGVALTAHAHKVNLFAYTEGDQVYVQGYFSDGKTAKNSEVTVFGGDGRELMKGQTNEEGIYTFPVQGKQGLRIVLNAGQGHQASYDISQDEILGEPAKASSPVTLPNNDETSTSDANNAMFGEAPQMSEAMMRRAVAQGVLPLAREIAELKERRGFTEIVGGIGFITGLFGLFAYFKARQGIAKK